MKRTNIVLDESLIKEAIKLTGLKTYREVVHSALKILINFQKRQALISLAGSGQWKGNLKLWRQRRKF